MLLVYVASADGLITIEVSSIAETDISCRPVALTVAVAGSMPEFVQGMEQRWHRVGDHQGAGEHDDLSKGFERRHDFLLSFYFSFPFFKAQAEQKTNCGRYRSADYL